MKSNPPNTLLRASLLIPPLNYTVSLSLSLSLYKIIACKKTEHDKYSRIGTVSDCIARVSDSGRYVLGTGRYGREIHSHRYTDELADTIVDWIPGLKDIRLKDIPFVEIDNCDFPMREMEEAYKASGIIFNTFDILEQDVLDAISAMFPHVYTIGPLQLLLNSTSDDGLKSISCSLWEEESECLQWLNSMKPNSVVYISFGSVAVMEPQQLTEFAWGIVNSNQPFLWIIRPNLVMGEAAALPPELLEKIKGRGMIAKWCQQERVLKHPSVGGFLTHCGWNSTLDSLCAGVPILCWPWLGDQCINRRYSCTHWGIGIEMNKDVKRDEVEKLVRNLMEGNQGKELKKKIMEWKKLAVEATSDGGSSFMNLEKLVNEVLG